MHHSQCNILYVCIVSGELPLVSSTEGKGKAVDVGSLLNEFVLLWTRIPSAHVMLHLLFSEPTLSAIINSSDLQVTTNRSRLYTAYVVCYNFTGPVSVQIILSVFTEI